MNKLIAPFTLALATLGVTLTGFLVSAHAAQAASSEDGNILDLARPIFDEIMKGHYIAAAAFALVLTVALVKRYAPGKAREFVQSDPGGALLTLLMAFGGALGTATMTGAPWTWGMLWTSLGVGIAAMGGYTAIKKLFVEPLLRPLMARAPAWAQPLFALVMWIFDKPTLAGQKASADGALAVAKSPATGTTSVTGQPKDL